MKRYVVALAVMLLGIVVVYAQQKPLTPEQQAAQEALKAARAQEEAGRKATPQLQIKEEVLNLVVPGHTIGETNGVAKDSKGNLYVYSRSGSVGIAKGGAAAELFQFDPNLKFIKQWGPGNYAASFAHAVRVDKYDNVWMIDEGANMVVKFNPQGQVMMVLGRKVEAIDYLLRFMELGEHIESQYTTGGPTTFNRPTDVAWDTQDNIFIADGYNNSRVEKRDKYGNHVATIGERGSGPNQFNLPHAIANDAKGLIYVADRGNRRVQVFDPDLKPVRIIGGMGQPWGVCVSPGPTQYLWSGDSDGKLYKFTLDGKMVGWAPTRLNKGQASCMIHQLHCESETVIYSGDCSMWMVEKLTISK